MCVFPRSDTSIDRTSSIDVWVSFQSSKSCTCAQESFEIQDGCKKKRENVGEVVLCATRSCKKVEQSPVERKDGPKSRTLAKACVGIGSGMCRDLCDEGVGRVVRLKTSKYGKVVV